MSETSLKQFQEITISTRIDTMKIPATNPETLTAALFNGMVSPISLYGIKGFLWYQGESNKDAGLYGKLLPAMVKEWRQLWGDKKLSFYYVQITPWNYQDRNTAFLREAQLQAKIPYSGMVVGLDAGQRDRIHPPNKLLIATRLSDLALAKTYRQKHIPFKSPELKSVSYKIPYALLTFKNVYRGLQSRNKELMNFEMAGTDQIFYPAKATITGKDKITLICDRVTQPVAVRYAFKNWVNGDLYNSENFPASSFRMDNYNVRK
jgi:sialate O-acetylesterase